MLDGGGDGQGAGTHDHDDIGGVRGADVIKQVVLPTGEGGELVHVGLDDGRHGLVELVHGLAAGEVHVRVLGGTADGRTVRGQGALAVGDDQVFVDHGAHVVHGQLLDLHDLVGGAEAVEEVDEGNARLQGGLGGDQGEILGFLNVLGTQQAPAGLAGGHDITVVAEDGQTLAGDGAGGYMEDRGDQLAGDLVHVGDHEQQALGGGEGGAQCTSAQRTVNGAGHTGLGLHLGDDRDGTPDVLLLGGGLGVRFGRHRRGRRDGIDGYDFTCGICNVRTCLVSVNGDHFSRHKIILLTRWLVFSGSSLPETVKTNAMKKVPQNLKKCTSLPALVCCGGSVDLDRNSSRGWWWEEAIRRGGASGHGSGVDCRNTAKDDSRFLPGCNDFPAIYRLGARIQLWNKTSLSWLQQLGQ